MPSSWSETTLPAILSNYKLEDIFNADEFGLFYQCLPDETYRFKGEKFSGGKSNVKLTGIAAASATGEKMRMLVIWKFKNPRCFKNVNHLPCEYKSQKKSWMNSNIFEEWVRKLLSVTIVQPIHLRFDQRSNRIFSSKYDVDSSTDGPRCHTQP